MSREICSRSQRSTGEKSRTGSPALSSGLITCFEPFGGRTENASREVLEELRALLPHNRYEILPVDAISGPERLIAALVAAPCAYLLMLGEAEGSSSVRLETTAWNELNFRIADNSGNLIERRSIRSDGPPHHASTLPLRAIATRFRSATVPYAISDDPGRFLCNQVFFTARDFLECGDPSSRIPAGFIHVPVSRPPEPTAIAAALASCHSDLITAAGL